MPTTWYTFCVEILLKIITDLTRQWRPAVARRKRANAMPLTRNIAFIVCYIVWENKLILLKSEIIFWRLNFAWHSNLCEIMQNEWFWRLFENLWLWIDVFHSRKSFHKSIWVIRVVAAVALYFHRNFQRQKSEVAKRSGLFVINVVNLSAAKWNCLCVVKWYKNEPKKISLFII